ncbi:flippase [Limnobacter sp.]|uniref:flippase n=1 Tax=Limnobacter sp. TaxID=2003368 RepID=UPI00311E5053
MNLKKTITQTLRERPNLSLFGENSFWLIGDKLIKLLVAVFVSAWVARYLGPEQFGILAYATTFVAMFQAFSLLGLDNIVVRDVASNPDKASNILGTALRLRLGGSAIAYSALLLTLLLTTKNEPTLLAVTLTIGLCLFFQVTDVIDLWFQANSQNRRTVIAKTSSYLLIASFKIGLILSGATLFYFAAAQVLETVFSAIALCVSYLYFKTKSNWTWDWDIAKRILQQSWPILISGLSILIYMRISVFYLQSFSGTAAVGVYAAGTSLSEVWYFIPTMLAASAAPIIARKRLDDKAGYTLTFKKLFALMWYFSLFIASINVVLSSFLINLLYGDDYQRSSAVLATHAFSLIAVSLGVFQSIWIVNEGRTRLSLYQALTGAAVAVILGFFLIPQYGVIGAAATTVCAQFAQAFFANAVFAPALFRLQITSLWFFIDRSKHNTNA